MPLTDYDLLEVHPWQLRKGVRSRSGLNALRTKAMQCTACELSQSRKQVVFGEGASNAELMCIGEAPGMHEDRQGEPFVGRAGQLLTSILLSIGLKREEIYIANVLKCRPPNNRDPSSNEVDACTPFLKEQIKLIQPKVIFALGRHAAHYLLKTDLPLSRLRSKWHEYEDCALLVGYHPAYLLRNPKDKAKMWDDLCLLKTKLS